jgi:hypothetical protein
MSNSSQPTISSIDLSNTKSIDDILKECMTIASGSSCDTITISPSDMSYNYTVAGAPSTYSIGSSGISTITLNGIDASNYSFNLPQEWIGCFPDWNRVEDMCKEYPGLKIAFENFKVFYEMVKDDYDNPTPKK